MKILAIIPARGGSKGILNKNIKPLNEKPLIGYTIEQAKNSKLIDKVVVSTDNEKIKKVSLDFDAQVIDRPNELATDEALSEPVLFHALDELKKESYEPDIIVFLQCTCPFRRKDDIDDAIKMLQSGYDSVIAVFESKWFIWKNENKRGTTVNFDHNARMRRQDRPKEYTESGSLFVFSRKGFEQHKNRLFGKIGLYVMPKNYSFEIDTPIDFKIADFAAKNLIGEDNE